MKAAIQPHLPMPFMAHSNITRAGATPNDTMSERESYSAPKALCVRVSRATRPSSPSRIMAMKMATAACSKRPVMACTMA